MCSAGGCVSRGYDWGEGLVFKTVYYCSRHVDASNSPFIALDLAAATAHGPNIKHPVDLYVQSHRKTVVGDG